MGVLLGRVGPLRRRRARDPLVAQLLSCKIVGVIRSMRFYAAVEVDSSVNGY
jgi:hypothetical protein